MRKLKDPIHSWRVDASENRRPGIVGIGLVLRLNTRKGGRGAVLKELKEAYADVAPGAGEALAIYRALELSLQFGFDCVQVWCDYNALRRKLRGALRSNAISGLSPRNAMILARANEVGLVQFRYVPRRRNYEAHILAREAALSMDAVGLSSDLKLVFERITPPDRQVSEFVALTDEPEGQIEERQYHEDEEDWRLEDLDGELEMDDDIPF